MDMFEEIYALCADDLIVSRVYKHVGTDGISFITPHNMLILTLLWLRQYPAYKEMAIEWDIAVTTLKRLLLDVLHILDRVIVPAYIKPLQPTDPSSSYSQHQNAHMVIDSTFIPVPRAGTDSERRVLFHFKSPTKFALKVQVTCNMNNMIIDVSDVVHGSKADVSLVDESKVLQQLEPEQVALGDSGYQGRAQITVPSRKNSTKRKKENLQPNVTRLQKSQRKELQSQRSVIANINQRLKCWRIVKGVYRAQRQNYTDITMIARVVSALCNVYMQRYPIRQESE